MAKEIRDPLTIIGSLERGDVTAALGEEIEKTLKALYDAAGPKGKAKGTVTLTLAFDVQGQSCGVEAAIASKTPKTKRSTSMFFVTQDGALTQEHPQQIAMFPRDSDERVA
jgi:hypothetical protein